MTPAKKTVKKAAKKATKKAVKKSSARKAPAKKAAAKKAPAKKAAAKKSASTKAAKAKSTAKSVATLHKAGLIDHATMTDDNRKRLAKLKPEEVKALVAAKKKLGFAGKLTGPGADFF